MIKSFISLFFVVLGFTVVGCSEEVTRENVLVYKEEAKFCGWPANEGIWSWRDEILVGFEISGYIKNDDGHSIDRNSPKYIYFARSLDGGKNWQVEKPKDILSPVYLEDPDMFKFGKNEAMQLAVPMNFAHPEFVLKLRANRFYYSYDKGKSWSGPFLLPNFGKKLIMARTDYIVFGEKECVAFISSSMTDGNYGKTFGIRTKDGGLTWEKEGWVTDEFPPKEYRKFSFSIMPSTERISDSKLITALRQRLDGRKWLDVYESEDKGRSWNFLSTVGEEINNPPSLVKLSDGRLVMVYCYRHEPYGLRAKISGDQGKSWSDEIILRDDALSWDIGYVQSVERKDGKIVSVYYYHTKEDPKQRIEATIWKP